MRIIGMAALTLSLSVATLPPARADQTDPKLDPLFASLKAAQSPDDARSVEGQIWAIWGRSNDATVDRLMTAGITWLGAGEYGRALATFDQVVMKAPKFAEGWNKRATTLYLMERYDDSQRDIARVLALEPRHFGALSGLGMCDMRQHRTKQAIEALQGAQAIDPNLPGIASHIEELRKQLERESI